MSSAGFMGENLREYRSSYAIALAAMLAVACTTAFVAYIFKDVINKIYYQRREDLIVPICLGDPCGLRHPRRCHLCAICDDGEDRQQYRCALPASHLRSPDETRPRFLHRYAFGAARGADQPECRRGSRTHGHYHHDHRQGYSDARCSDCDDGPPRPHPVAFCPAHRATCHSDGALSGEAPAQYPP